jgi:hypothetical protein
LASSPPPPTLQHDADMRLCGNTLLLLEKALKRSSRLVKNAYADKAITRTQMYDILKKMKEGKLAADQRHLNSKRKKRSLVFIANVTANIEND